MAPTKLMATRTPPWSNPRAVGDSVLRALIFLQFGNMDPWFYPSRDESTYQEAQQVVAYIYGLQSFLKYTEEVRNMGFEPGFYEGWQEMEPLHNLWRDGEIVIGRLEHILEHEPEKSAQWRFANQWLPYVRGGYQLLGEAKKMVSAGTSRSSDTSF
ncbi:hypothetical protein HYU13_02430 [Candidatus Woesearchaeota archaeon]|nr:hypothetical protein [Candidatus Woesearchaeota archaeon]